ncbi:MAG: Sporulation related domain [Bacteroidetes bacterium]|nr:Sporulation related domain [Bacteroidota bacterium]
MRGLAYFLPAAWAVLGFWGCGSSEGTRQPTPSATSAGEQAPRLGFETSVDTVNTVSEGDHAGATETPREGQIRFMIQIGAFKDARNANRIQGITRERYHLPVLNDYNIKLDLYQIRIGFFETREQALLFRQQMQAGFPSDYKDAWVVQLIR